MSSINGLVLLDTSVLIHLLRGDELGRRLDGDFGLRRRPERPLISIISLGESLALAEHRRWSAERIATLENLIRELVVVDIDSRPVLRSYASLYDFCRRNGSGIGQNDLWIAACAVAAGATLLTTDRDFDPIHPQWITRIWIDPKPSTSSL